ncbi:DUF3298 domain-containing protein [Ornithinibacillus sp. L9]|uniref:DUF3298 domain-containing protein n=1 Tax=Ornithinibacillus caprae TaxID=2678566 RepID=A0A6N8FL39_9BACI|nr:DUF3298 and DUF4163 domain-containing protein [Ornithinibacillus caprae]MUK90360.1 DUF3298 domain-containing protein [Ornithinibacillus caprae]
MPVSFPVRIDTLKVDFGRNKNIYYPRVDLQNQQLEQFINQQIVNQAQQLINQQIGNLSTTVEEMLGTYEIKNNQRDILSLSQSNYTYHYQAAHGMTYMKSLTFDTKQGTLYKLSDLFKPGSNYINRLSSFIQLQIKERDIQTLEEFTKIKPDQDFYIADKTLVIYFQLYEITPYVFGFPMFPISVYNLQDILKEDGPLGRMAVNN